ncbi:MAG: VOC family protein [Ilumatobacteraceae bacterium]
MTKLKDIVFDCHNAPRLARFWAAALDDFEIRPYDQVEIERLAGLGLTPETDPVVMVDGPIGSLCFQEVEGSTNGKNRLHLDLSTHDRRSDVARLVSLGASVEAVYDDHTVLADPQGNAFCVYDGGD